MSDFKIKQGDELPVLDVTLVNADGTALNLTTATGVDFRMRLPGETAYRVNAAGSILVAASGTVRYEWAAGDTDVAGQYDAEFVATFSGARTLTAPTCGCFTVTVEPLC